MENTSSIVLREVIWRSRAKPALPYIVRLMSFNLVTCPPTMPLLIDRVRSALTAPLSFQLPLAPHAHKSRDDDEFHEPVTGMDGG
jgi:hypothetical protein